MAAPLVYECDVLVLLHLRMDGQLGTAHARAETEGLRLASLVPVDVLLDGTARVAREFVPSC